MPVRISILAVVLSLLFAACGDTGEVAPTHQPSEVSTPESTRTPEPTLSPAASSPPAPVTKLLFLRDQDEIIPEVGDLWIANMDGSGAQRLASEGEPVSFAGAATISDRSYVYYLAGPAESDRTLWQFDIENGERDVVLVLESPAGWTLDADVSGDGRWLAYTSEAGVSVVDLANDQERVVLQRGECELVDCFGYHAPIWSRDGELLLVRKAFYETGTAIVVDPWSQPARELTESHIADGRPSQAVWSSDGNGLCAFGQYAAPSSLYVAYAPDWVYQSLLPEYEKGLVNGVSLSVSGCDWLDNQRIAVASTRFADGVESSDLFVYDAATGESSTIATFGSGEDGGALSLDVIRVPGQDAVVAQYVRRPHFEPAQPVLVDASTGSVEPILSPRDWVVGAVVVD